MLSHILNYGSRHAPSHQKLSKEASKLRQESLAVLRSAIKDQRLLLFTDPSIKVEQVDKELDKFEADPGKWYSDREVDKAIAGVIQDILPQACSTSLGRNLMILGKDSSVRLVRSLPGTSPSQEQGEAL